MFKVNESKDANAHQLIDNIFHAKVEDVSSYVIAYGYYMKSGLFSKKIFNYVIGFSETEKKLAIIPFDSQGNSGDLMLLSKDNILSAKYGMQGDVKIKTASDELRLTVPGYTPTTLESAGILPINQEDQAVRFKSFIKGNF